MDNGIGKGSPIYVQNICFKTHLMPPDPLLCDGALVDLAKGQLCQVTGDSPGATHFPGAQTWPHFSSIRHLLWLGPVLGLSLQG